MPFNLFVPISVPTLFLYRHEDMNVMWVGQLCPIAYENKYDELIKTSVGYFDWSNKIPIIVKNLSDYMKPNEWFLCNSMSELLVKVESMKLDQFSVVQIRNLDYI